MLCAGITTINGGTLTVSGNFPRFYFIDTEGSDLDAYIVNNSNLLAFGKTNSPTPSNDVLTLNLSSYLATFMKCCNYKGLRCRWTHKFR